MSDKATVSPEAKAAWTAYVDEVKSRMAASAVDVIGRDTKLEPQGRGLYRGLAPLRKEKTPSFHVYPDGGWHDFGTGESGDLLSYIRKRDNSSFREAVDTLAGIFGIPTWDDRKKALAGTGAPVPTEDQLHELWNAESDRRRVFEAITAIVHYCHGFLPSQVRRHLRNHYGLSDWFIATEKIGWVSEGLWELCRRDLPYDKDTLWATGFFHRMTNAKGDRKSVV